MKKICVIIGLFLSLQSFGQSFKALVKAGDEAFEQQDFHAALHYYVQALEFKPEQAEINYKYAEAALHFNALEKAEKHYRRVLKNKERDKFPDTRFQLGQVYQKLGDYDKALEHFGNYITQAAKGTLPFDKVEKAIKACHWAKDQLLRFDSLLQIERLSKKINTGYSEFGAYQSGDTLYYSSYRYEYKKDKNRPPRKYAKVLTSVRGAKGRTLRRNFNEDTLHTAHTAFSLDRKRIYFNRCRYVNGAEIRCAIYYREKDRRGRWKVKPVKLPESINWKDHTSTQPSIGFDSVLNVEVLFYASDRPGGKGGMDIWQVKIQEGDNQFSTPMPIASINTAYGEITPFFHTESQQLYFSSDGHQGMGGYDVFQTLRGASWGEPMHLGVPLNSSYNEVYYFLGADSETGYFSSNRPGSYYLDSDNKACCNDIYRFSWREPEVLELDKTQPEDAEIVIIPPNPVTRS